MLYELMARKEIHVPSRRVGTPFEEAAIEQERKTMESELRESKELRQLYPRLLPLAAAMVERDPARRPTADGIPTRLACEWRCLSRRSVLTLCENAWSQFLRLPA